MINYLTIFLLFISFFAVAQQPTVKVDLNMAGRKMAEVNEPGYNSWVVGAGSDSKTLSGVTFALTAKAKEETGLLRTSWSKALIQSPYFARLVNDGVMVENGDNGAQIELRINNLPVGSHTIQTYHNVWKDTSKVNFCPINISLNGTLVHSQVAPSVQAKLTTDATVVLTNIEQTKAGQEIVLLFESAKDFNPTVGKIAKRNVFMNGFELNAADASKQAREPLPKDGDIHVDADCGSLNLQWKPSLKATAGNHTLYFGIDSAKVATATNNDLVVCKGEFSFAKTEFKVDGLYNLNTYYWRVDEIDSTGHVTKGEVWSFKPRHLAFRGAEGYGRLATGGRGGKVVEVTNLNDDGPGSLREAITNSIGPRTIVFNVSGIITLKSRLVVKDQFITIAGQTAPGKGICLRAAPLGIGSETICRFIRSRLGAGDTYDGLGMAGANHSIVDHCSVSWTLDEAFSSRNGKNLTLQRTLISEALNIAGHANYKAGSAHGFAATIGGDVGSFHHNLLAHCSGRNWSLGGGLDGNGYYAGRLDIFNNLVYNWGHRATDGGAHEVNFVNNYYKEGVATTKHLTLRAQLEGVGKGSQSYYYSGNILQNTDGSFACDGTDDTCGRTYVTSNGQQVNWQVFVDKPFFPSYAKIETAKDAYKSILSDVGCNMPMFDDHDKRIVKETLEGTYTYVGSKSKVGGIIDHQDEAGGYENYPEEIRTADFDTDHDGLPNWWEDLHGSNPNSNKGDYFDSNADEDKDGYTALEDYLEWMSVPHFFLKANEQKSVELSGFTLGYKHPTFACAKAANFDLSFDNSKVNITPNTNAIGINYLHILVKDKDGSEFTRIIGICVGID